MQPADHRLAVEIRVLRHPEVRIDGAEIRMIDLLPGATRLAGKEPQSGPFSLQACDNIVHKPLVKFALQNIEAAVLSFLKRFVRHIGVGVVFLEQLFITPDIHFFFKPFEAVPQRIFIQQVNVDDMAKTVVLLQKCERLIPCPHPSTPSNSRLRCVPCGMNHVARPM